MPGGCFEGVTGAIADSVAAEGLGDVCAGSMAPSPSAAAQNGHVSVGAGPCGSLTAHTPCQLAAACPPRQVACHDPPEGWAGGSAQGARVFRSQLVQLHTGQHLVRLLSHETCLQERMQGCLKDLQLLRVHVATPTTESRAVLLRHV